MYRNIKFIFLFTLLLIINVYTSACLPTSPESAQNPVILSNPTSISAEQAIAVAVNNIVPTTNGFQLSHPQHQVTFTADGITFAPMGGGPTWRWQLRGISAATHTASSPLKGMAQETIPFHPASTVIRYDRGSIHEEYHARQNVIEQQFIIPQPLDLAGGDLVIDGVVSSLGDFVTAEHGWQWWTDKGQVTLGDVTVFDATGKTLPATLEVTADSTHLTVDGQALAQASYPVTIDPEIGTNDFRISDMGSAALDDTWAIAPQVTYNHADNEYLVVWQGRDNQGMLSMLEYEIYGQRIDASTGAEVGKNDFRISDMGPDGDQTYNALSPTAIFNPITQEYLVVWIGDDNTASLVNGEFEVFGQFLDKTGQEIGTNDFRISDMGPNGNPAYDVNPQADVALAFNLYGDYLVVWVGDDNTNSLVDNEYEVFGQRLDGLTKTEIGDNDFRISDMGLDGATNQAARSVDVVFGGIGQGEYLVVWEGIELIPLPSPLISTIESEIYGQRLDANTGAELGTNDFRISNIGGFGSADYAGQDPAIAYNNDDKEYLVVWSADDNIGSLADDEFEIFGQRLDSTGTLIGENDFRISDMGPDGDNNYFAVKPDVAYSHTSKKYFVVWEGTDSIGSPATDQNEIYGQILAGATGAELLENDFRLSNMGPNDDGTTAPPSILTTLAKTPAIGLDHINGGYLIVWGGIDTTDILEGNEVEIHGQLMGNNDEISGPNDFRISDMWSDKTFDASDPAVAYNSQNNEYLVVWSGNNGVWLNDTQTFEVEIFGQRLDANTGAEIGDNDFRISTMGPNGNIAFSAFSPAITYNNQNNEYLVVWSGDDNTPPLTNNEYEIFGQRLNAETGAQIGQNDFRISDMGANGSSIYGASFPTVAYNSQNNEYLVIWEGDDDSGSLVNDEFEIYGQRLNAETGAEVGQNDFRISDMGPDGMKDFTIFSSFDVTYNSQNNEYLVVWSGDEDTPPLTDNEYEIFGQRLNAETGAEVGQNDFRISDMGPDGTSVYGAADPRIAYNQFSNEYLVVWWGDDNVSPLVNSELEVFGQRLDGAGAEIGDNDFRISTMGPNGNTSYQVDNPQVVFNSTNREYIVVWDGIDDGDAGQEIYGQRLSVTGTAVDTHFRVSDMGPDGVTGGGYVAFKAALATNSADTSSLIVWQGDDNSNGLADDENEIFGQQVSFTADPTLSGSNKIYLPLVTK